MTQISPVAELEATRLLGMFKYNPDQPRVPAGESRGSKKLIKSKPKTPPSADPDDQSEAAKRARRSIKREVNDTFDFMRDKVAKEAADAFDRNDNADEAVDAIDLGTLDDLASGAVPDALHDVFVNAGHRALDSMGVDDQGIIDIFNKRAYDYAQSRGAELVGRKWVNGKLVDNPDAKWAITDTTRDKLRNLIAKSYEDGKTPRELAGLIQDSFLFSENRADMIAYTETAKASVQGSLGAWKDSGVVKGKSWQMSNDHDQDDECNLNEADGVIALDDTFSSGDDGPPAHPGCWCACSASLEGPEDQEEEEDETEKLAKGEDHRQGWIGVDFDGTLARYDEDRSTVGPPTAMLDRVKQWLANGEDVRIFTARVHDDPDGVQRKMIEEWCQEHIGRVLSITCVKDHQMVELWDDRAVRVERNTGEQLSPSEKLLTADDIEKGWVTLENKEGEPYRVLLDSEEPTSRTVPKREKSSAGEEIKFGGSAEDDNRAKEYLKRLGDPWFERLPKVEKLAIVGYTASEYLGINSYLRDTPGRISSKDEQLKLEVHRLDQAIKGFTVPEPLVVYRGISRAVKLPGRTFVDKGFVSTSLIPGWKLNPEESKGRLQRMAIHIPAGVHAAPVDGYSLYPQERELLLPRGARFRILSTDKKGTIHLRMLK